MNLDAIAAQALQVKRGNIALALRHTFGDVTLHTYKTIGVWPEMKVVLIAQDDSVAVCNDLAILEKYVDRLKTKLDMQSVLDLIQLAMPDYCRLLDDSYVDLMEDCETHWEIPICNSRQLCIYILDGVNESISKWNLVADEFTRTKVGKGPRLWRL